MPSEATAAAGNDPTVAHEHAALSLWMGRERESEPADGRPFIVHPISSPQMFLALFSPAPPRGGRRTQQLQPPAEPGMSSMPTPACVKRSTHRLYYITLGRHFLNPKQLTIKDINSSIQHTGFPNGGTRLYTKILYTVADMVPPFQLQRSLGMTNQQWCT